MQKLITLRFAAKCRRCQTQIPAGERAYWLGKSAGVQHVNCSPNPTLPIEIGKPVASESQETTFDYSEIAQAFKLFQDDPMQVYKHSKNEGAGKSLAHDSWGRVPSPGGNPWAGCSVPEMNQWISEGYRVEGLSEVSSLVPSKPRRKMVYGEEGDELLLDSVWSGSDEPFVTWEKRNRKPGLSVEIGMVFSAFVDSRLIAQYEKWIARALQTLDENGVDMEVNLVIKVTRADSDDYTDKPKTAKIRVRKAGEASDFANWSAMFSPGGFRMLGIMAIGMMVDREGGRVSFGYGSPRPHGKWDVLYDENRNVLQIGECPNGPFPEIEMTEKLVTVLSKLSQ